MPMLMPLAFSKYCPAHPDLLSAVTSQGIHLELQSNASGYCPVVFNEDIHADFP